MTQIASVVAAKTVDSPLSKFMGDKVMQYWEAGEKLAVQFAGASFEAILQVVRFNAVADLLTGIVLIISYILLYKYIIVKTYYFFHNRAVEHGWQGRPDSDYIAGKWLVTMILSCIAITFVVRTLPQTMKVFNAWTYVTIYEPKLGLAKIAVDAVVDKVAPTQR